MEFGPGQVAERGAASGTLGTSALLTGCLWNPYGVTDYDPDAMRWAAQREKDERGCCIFWAIVGAVILALFALPILWSLFD